MGLPLAVVTSCRKLAWSLRSGHLNPRLSKKGTASLTGPWNISSLQTNTEPSPQTATACHAYAMEH